HVYRTFGRTHAAQVANVISYRPKSAVRDAARALGYDVGQADAWSKSIERWGSLRGRDPSSPAADRAAKERALAAKSSGSPDPAVPWTTTRTARKDAATARLWGSRDWSPDLTGRGARVVDPLAVDEGDVLRADDTQ